jgi:tRNA pseudouridine38-40 synthase
MPRYFIQLAYDGTDYFGWQAQPHGKTVQQVLSRALTTLLNEDLTVVGAGRTDTGVHASYFIAHFDLGKALTYTPEKLIFKLNRFLPDDIVIYRIQEVPESLHARFSATYRTYHYHISAVKPLFTRKYSHYLFGSLETAAIQQCCQIIEKSSDFTSFSKLHTDVKTNICKVKKAKWEKVDNGFLFEIQADRFLRNMVRSIVGTLLDVGQGKIDVEGFQRIVDSRDRGSAGQSAPAAGLFLVDIGYPDLAV